MKTYPIKTLNITEATELQFKLIECITNEFTGKEILNLGDLGVVQPNNKPNMTLKVEKVLAEFFQTEDALLVRGAGTGALRYCMFSLLSKDKNIIVHDAPIYPTTKTTLDIIGANIHKIDFNDLQKLEKSLENTNVELALIQYSRQKPSDSYSYEKVVNLFDKYNITIITDDNYAALKISKLGASICNGVSTFSSFKLQGPEGIGVIVGSKNIIKDIKNMNYSGGSQVQGYEAHEVLRGFISAPVSLAIQSNEVDELKRKLIEKNIDCIKNVFVANAQSKVCIVEFTSELSEDLIIECEKLGAACNPVGAESKYEFVPMIYRVSSTFSTSDSEFAKRSIRINPMKSSSDTIIKILERGIKNVFKQDN